MSVTEVGAGRKTLVDTATRGGAAAGLRPAAGGGKWADRYARNKPENPLAGGRYKTSDNRWLLLALLQGDKAWPIFTKAIGRDDLAADARFGNEQSRAANAAPIAHDFSEALGVANTDSPLLTYQRKEDATRLLACLEELGAERRDIVLKAYVFGMSRRQIAETIGRPLATLKTWLRRALSELTEALDEAEALPQNA